MTNTFWNERYSQSEYVYGELPNAFFKEILTKLPLGDIILPCDGEGRNAVFAASKCWKVKAFDLSEAGKIKADNLALKFGVSIDFQLMDAKMATFEDQSADVVALIYTHLPSNVRSILHANSVKWLKPGGHVILEAFCPDQIKNTSGGPKDLDMLYTKEMLLNDFKDLRIDQLEYKDINLNEGKFHEGRANVIRMTARKE